MTTPKTILPLLTVNFIGSFGFSLVILSLVFLVDRYGGNGIIYGIIAAMYPFFQFIGFPILGKLSDRYGRKKVLLASQIGSLIAWIIYFSALFIPVQRYYTVENSVIGTFELTLPLVVLFISRALEGFFAGNVSVAQAYIADITTETNRRANYGKLAMATNLGFISGPAIAGLLGATSGAEKGPVFLAIIFSVLAIIFITLYLPESHVGKEYIIKRNTTFFILHKKGVLFTLILYFLIFFSFNIYYTAFPLYVTDQFNWSFTHLGIFFSAVALLMAFVQGPGLAYLSKKISEPVIITAGAGILMINFFLLTVLSQVSIYIGAVFFAVGNGIMWPSLLSKVSQLSGEQTQGELQGITGSSGAIASGIGLIMGGYLYELSVNQTFWIPAILICLVYLLSFRWIVEK